MIWELILFLAAIIGIPTMLLLFVSRIARLIFFIAGLVFGFGIGFVMELGGPDSPALIVPVFGFALSVAAAIAELVIVLWARAKKAPMQRLAIKSGGSRIICAVGLLLSLASLAFSILNFDFAIGLGWFFGTLMVLPYLATFLCGLIGIFLFGRPIVRYLVESV